MAPMGGLFNGWKLGKGKGNKYVKTEQSEAEIASGNARRFYRGFVLIFRAALHWLWRTILVICSSGVIACLLD